MKTMNAVFGGLALVGAVCGAVALVAALVSGLPLVAVALAAGTVQSGLFAGKRIGAAIVG